MDISKTMFKRFSQCDNYYYLDDLYKFNLWHNEETEEVKYILENMFDDDGESLIKSDDPLLEAMLGYYQETERLALEEASKYFGKNFTYHANTKNQKRLSRKIDDHTLYTYLDGYYEDEEEIIVLEVKATTSRKFLKLGPTIDKEFQPLFYEKDCIIKLKQNLIEKQETDLKKIYDKDSSVGKYFYDIAITNFIGKEEFLGKKVSFYLVVLNKDFVYDGKSIASSGMNLFSYIDCNQIVNNYLENIKNDYLSICKNIYNKNLSKTHYKKCVDCEYDSICFPKLQDMYSIRTLLSTKKVQKVSLNEMIENGYYKLTDIPYNLLENKNHIIQRDVVESGKEFIQYEEILSKIEQIKYPIYHLDFESLALPIPRFFGEKPYTQSVFQFSIHIQKDKSLCDRYTDNYYFLPEDFEDHREEMIKSMIDTIDLTNGGCVLVYNVGFEKSRLKELAVIFPQYKEQLEKIIEHLYDLMYVVKGHKSTCVNYYHPKLQGSFSIKKVLPIFSDLTYKNLDVSNGLEAVHNYINFSKMDSEDIKVLRKQLIEYCGLDTYSMAVILDNIKKKISEEYKNE